MNKRIFLSPSVLKVRNLALMLGVLAVRGWSASSQPVVINEIHYRPEAKTEPAKFIELYNSGTNEVELSNWRLAGGVSFLFPAGTRLGPDQYLVVAQNPAYLQQKFGRGALGPFLGDLSAKADKLSLCDAAGETVDEVDYRLGFPWPTVGDAPGCSIELINPALDNNLGGSWRSLTVSSVVTNTVVVNQARTNVVELVSVTQSWKYDQSGQDLGTDWLNPNYDDSAWPAGPALLYVETASLPWPKSTPLRFTNPLQMAFYFRTHFDAGSNLGQFTALQITALIDDGAVFYLNGQEVGRVGMPTGPIRYSTAAARTVGDATTAEVLSIPSTTLMPGDNLLAVEVHQANNQSSDIVFGMKLDGVIAVVTNTVTNVVVSTNAVAHGPTPGRRNASFAASAPPQIRQVSHQPKQPQSNEPVRITAKVTGMAGVAAVTLSYQLVDPGNYIALSDPAYQLDWTAIPMNDAGIEGDETAADQIYTVVLPAGLQTHRRLVRYRISARGADGLEVSVPYADDPQPNFAYFVYDGVPAWSGAARPGITPVQNFDTNVVRRLPVYHLISKRNAIEQATWLERYGGSLYKWSGTLVYDGDVYDHVHYRARGGVWRYSMVKNMWKFDFNRGHDFQARDDFGQPYKTAWTKLNLGACIQQGDYQHRGEQGMFEAVGFKLFNLAGVEACRTHWIQLRIIDDAVEASPTDQFLGDFWGLYLVVEQMDGRFLDEHHLPDGNLYKMEGGGTLNNQGPRAVTDGSDLQRFMATYSGNPSDDWWRTNFNLASYYGYQAIIQGIHHYDVGAGKNYFYYLNPETGIWSVYPWDLDLTWADNMYDAGGQGAEPFKNRVLPRPAFNLEYKNRLRELRDLLFNDDQTWQLIDEYAAIIHDPAGGLSITDADRAMWDYNPKMANSTYSTAPSKAGQGRFYQFPVERTLSKDFSGTVQLMKNYVVTRGKLLDSLAADPYIPGTPTIISTGSTNFPVNRLSFSISPFAGNGEGFAALAWRVGEVTTRRQPAFVYGEPRQYEIHSVWESGELTAFSESCSIPSGILKVGHSYRVRARMKDTTGRWSHWSAAVEFIAGEPDQAVALEQSLCLSELMVNPAGGSQYEYLELHNLDANTGLDLGGATFTKGITFTFPPGTTIPPSGYLLVVKADATNNYAGFRAQYGLSAEVPIVGPYSGSLANEGEQITLKTAANGQELLDFTYGSGRAWSLAAVEAGHSLVPLPAAQVGQAHLGFLDYGGNWQASAFMSGSPGHSEPSSARAPLINEVMANTAYVDPSNPDYVSNDWVELYNPTDAAIVLAGDWYLSDDAASLKKWAIPSTTIPPQAYVVFDEVSGFHRSLTNGFGLSKAGDQVYLSYLPGTAQDRVADCVQFKAQDAASSWGRYPDGNPFWQALPPTRGMANIPPAPHVIINELAYYPEMTATDPTEPGKFIELEYVELLNPTAAKVDLSAPNGAWRLAGGISYDFPAGTTLEPGACLVVVNFDPANSALRDSFMQAYNTADHRVILLGPYQGQLNNRSDRVALEKSLAVTDPAAPPAWIIVDEVIYGSQTPWPLNVAGFFISLQRLDPLRAGNDPTNWTGTTPSPGWVREEKALRLEPSRPSNGLLQLLVTGTPGGDYVLQGSTNLVDWTALYTNSAPSGSTSLFDVESTNHRMRFYRAFQVR